MTQVAHLELPGVPAESAEFLDGSVYFVGTATTVIRFGGFTILTDPNFLHAGDHVHLGYGLFSRRKTDPALEIHQLPPLDLCLLSHLHGDHFDRIAVKELSKDLPIVTTVHAASRLSGKGFRKTYGLKTWDAFSAAKGSMSLRVIAMPGRHAPGILNAMLPPVMGSMLEFRTGTGEIPARIYISGDTLLCDDLKEIPSRFRDIDLALLHLGGTRVLGVMVTMDGRQGAKAIRMIRPRKAIPIHYDDYGVFKSPLSDFKRAVDEAGLSSRVVYLGRGESYVFRVPAAGIPAQPLI